MLEHSTCFNVAIANVVGIYEAVQAPWHGPRQSTIEITYCFNLPEIFDDLSAVGRRLHPAYTEAGMEPEGEELSVQAAYTPESTCFGCGQAHLEQPNLHMLPYTPIICKLRAAWGLLSAWEQLLASGWLFF